MNRSAALARARSGSLDSAPATSSHRSSRRAAMRWTAPMKAPRPPPTMPRRNLRRRVPLGELPLIIMAFLPGSQSKHLAVGRIVGAGFGEVVENPFGHLDDVRLDEGRTFRRTLFRVLRAAFPFQHGPAVEAVLRKLGEDAAEIDLTIAQRTEAPRTVDPGLEAAIDALARGGVELRVLGVEHPDA